MTKKSMRTSSNSEDEGKKAEHSAPERVQRGRLRHEVASNREIPKDDDDRRLIDYGGSESTPEEGVQVLPTKPENLEASEETE